MHTRTTLTATLLSALALLAIAPHVPARDHDHPTSTSRHEGWLNKPVCERNARQDNIKTCRIWRLGYSEDGGGGALTYKCSETGRNAIYLLVTAPDTNVKREHMIQAKWGDEKYELLSASFDETEIQTIRGLRTRTYFFTVTRHNTLKTLRNLTQYPTVGLRVPLNYREPEWIDFELEGALDAIDRTNRACAAYFKSASSEPPQTDASKR